MSRHLAYRPNYRHTYQIVPPSRITTTRQHFSRTRWVYRCQEPVYEPHVLGRNLPFVPFGYYLVRNMFIPAMTVS